MNADNYLKSNESRNFDISFTDKEWRYIKSWMDDYAKHYHESELKKLRVGDVSRRSEQLVCDMCGSSKLEECGSDEYSCEDCGHFPITN